jgi:hypothetical protein
MLALGRCCRGRAFVRRFWCCLLLVVLRLHEALAHAAEFHGCARHYSEGVVCVKRCRDFRLFHGIFAERQRLSARVSPAEPRGEHVVNRLLLETTMDVLLALLLLQDAAVRAYTYPAPSPSLRLHGCLPRVLVVVGLLVKRQPLEDRILRKTP